MPRSGVEAVEIGDLAACVQDSALNHVTWRGLPVFDRVQAVARDTAWGTLESELIDLGIEHDDQTTVLTARAGHEQAGMPLMWDLSYTLTTNQLDLHLDAQALDDVLTNRLGWCLLHPLSQVGSAVTTWFRGLATSFRLPAHIAPQPVDSRGNPMPAWGPFDHMVLLADQLQLDIRFYGELFETEDQRNWTDASFKTYARPLQARRPFRLNRGDRFSQHVAVAMTPAPECPELPPASARPEAGQQTAVSVLLDDVAQADERALLAGWCDRVRIELGHDLANASVMIKRAQSHGAWELQVLADDETAWDALRTLLLCHPPELLLALPHAGVSGQPSERTARKVHVTAKAALGDVIAHIGGGTTMNFAELQRYPVDFLDYLTWTWSPTVHDRDPELVWRTIQSYPAIVATARTLAPAARLATGPLRDKADRLPEEWLLAALHGWLDCGVDSLCISRLSDLVHEGQLTPLGHSVAAACRARGQDSAVAKGWQ